MRIKRYGHISTLIGNRLYVLGGRNYGRDGGSLLKLCEFFDFDTWRWYKMCPMIKRRS